MATFDDRVTVGYGSESTMMYQDEIHHMVGVMEGCLSKLRVMEEALMHHDKSKCSELRRNQLIRSSSYGAPMDVLGQVASRCNTRDLQRTRSDVCAPPSSVREKVSQPARRAGTVPALLESAKELSSSCLTDAYAPVQHTCAPPKLATPFASYATQDFSSPCCPSSPRNYSASSSRSSSSSQLCLLSPTSSQTLTSPPAPHPPHRLASCSSGSLPHVIASSCTSSPRSSALEEVYSPGQNSTLFSRLSQYCSLDINLTLEITQRYKARMEMSSSSSSSPCSTCPSSPSSARSASSHAFSFDLISALAGLGRRQKAMACRCLKLASLLLKNPCLSGSQAFSSHIVQIATGCVAQDLLKLARAAGLRLHSHWQAVAIGQAVRHTLLSRGVPHELAQETVLLVKAVVDELIAVRRTL